MASTSEDRIGLPFAGPAGRILDKALVEAGIDRADTYVTNVVKHFKFEERGKRRIHKKPDAAEIRAPSLAGFGNPIGSAGDDRVFRSYCGSGHAGQIVPADTASGREVRATHPERGSATIHPSAILRAPDSDTRHAIYIQFVDDLRAAI